MTNNRNIQLPGEVRMDFQYIPAPWSMPHFLMQQGPVNKLWAIGGLTPLATMACHVAAGMPEHTPQEVVARAKELLDECARVQGGKA